MKNIRNGLVGAAFLTTVGLTQAAAAKDTGYTDEPALPADSGKAALGIFALLGGLALASKPGGKSADSPAATVQVPAAKPPMARHLH